MKWRHACVDLGEVVVVLLHMYSTIVGLISAKTSSARRVHRSLLDSLVLVHRCEFAIASRWTEDVTVNRYDGRRWARHVDDEE